MSVRCKDCGAIASYGNEIGHKSDCPALERERMHIRKMRFSNEWLRKRIEEQPDEIDEP